MVLSISSPDRFAQNENEAEVRYQKYKSIDPFPTIQSALLNSADLEDYVAATGMIVPFEPANLKPASYGVRLGGKCVYWDGDRDTFMVEDTESSFDGLQSRKTLTLRKNSITYIPVVPEFRLPEYIAMRFNLTIQNIYRGFLVGTGPLVDPGFTGRLWFPLHNLTNEEYKLDANEVIIYSEFTKLSRWRGWHRDRLTQPPRRKGRYHEFDPEKLAHRRDIDNYLYHANGGLPVTSSLQTVVESAKKAVTDAAQARASVDSIRDTARRRANITVALSLAALVVGLIGSLYVLVQILQSSTQIVESSHQAVAQLVQNASGSANEAKTDLVRIEKDIEATLAAHARSIADLEKALDLDRSNARDSEQQISAIGDQLAAIKDQLNDLQKKIAARHRRLPNPASKP